VALHHGSDPGDDLVLRHLGHGRQFQDVAAQRQQYMRDAKITQIYEGTNQIQREEISKILVSEHLAR
jgi:alkylation response protein AidB-like acyl-CoA dehydrogenase